jgi:hypothetical protein
MSCLVALLHCSMIVFIYLLTYVFTYLAVLSWNTGFGSDYLSHNSSLDDWAQFLDCGFDGRCSFLHTELHDCPPYLSTNQKGYYEILGQNVL